MLLDNDEPRGFGPNKTVSPEDAGLKVGKAPKRILYKRAHRHVRAAARADVGGVFSILLLLLQELSAGVKLTAIDPLRLREPTGTFNDASDQVEGAIYMALRAVHASDAVPAEVMIDDRLQGLGAMQEVLSQLAATYIYGAILDERAAATADKRGRRSARGKPSETKVPGPPEVDRPHPDQHLFALRDGGKTWMEIAEASLNEKGRRARDSDIAKEGVRLRTSASRWRKAR